MEIYPSWRELQTEVLELSGSVCATAEKKLKRRLNTLSEVLEPRAAAELVIKLTG